MRGASGPRPRPDEVVARVNAELCRDNASLIFVTLFFAMLDLPSRDALLLQRRAQPAVRDRRRRGRRAGRRGARQAARHPAELAYATATRTLAPGDCLYLYTDGITEATEARGGCSRRRGSRTAFARRAGAPARSIVEATIARVREFVGDTPQSDDIAAMAIRLIQ